MKGLLIDDFAMNVGRLRKIRKESLQQVYKGRAEAYLSAQGNGMSAPDNFSL
jgi:hypothetical protein